MKTKNVRMRQAKAWIRRMNKHGHVWDSDYDWPKALCHRICGMRAPYSHRF